jgi:ABC-type multidrug transport system permease subunit
MDTQKPMVYLGYALSGFLFLCGIVIATGIFMPSTMPEKFRIMFGVVMLLYGVYRFVNIRIKQQQRNEDRFLS